MKTLHHRILVIALAPAALLFASSVLQPAQAGIWVTTGPMNIARSGHTATLLPNGKVLVAGGGYNRGFFSSAELYDPATGTWTTTGSMAANRAYFTATLLPNGKVLVTGGLSSQGINNHALNGAELYDPTTGKWKVTGSMAYPRYYPTATLLPNGKVLVAGGNKLGGDLSSAEIYDPATETWTNTGSMTIPRMEATATLLTNGKVLVVGGVNQPGAELYDPAAGVWTVTGSMSEARRAHTATLLPNGKVLVAGGVAAEGVISSAELYDPDTGAWMKVGRMATARAGHTATLLPDGKVLVTGGGLFTDSTELYQPDTGTWVDGGEMSEARDQHTATLLPDGTVLVAGGQNQIGNVVDPVSSADLYVKAPATVTLSNLAQTYTGTPRSISVTTTPPGLAVDVTYNGLTNAPINPGSYTVIGTIDDPDYRGGATDTLVISQAATITALTNVTEDYLFPGQSLAANYLVSPVAPGGGTPTGTVTLTNELSAVTGPAPAGTLTMLLTNVGSFHFAVTYSGDTNFLPSSSSPPVSRTVLSMTNPAAWSAGLVISNGTRFLQTSLMQQLLTLTNVTSQMLAAVRVTIHLSAADLNAHIIVYNASGANSAGEPYLQYNYPVPPGGHVTFTAEYYSPDRVTVPHPTFTVELVTPETLTTPPPGTPEAVSRPPVVLAPDNALLLDFATEAGATYYILYKDDLASTNWNVAQPPVMGTGYDVQWVDDGPPKTESPPSAVPQRYYEVLKAN
jgi:N-acetylneuraminic acid mutarotase